MANVSKTQLVQTIATNASLSQKQASEALNATLDAITNALAAGDSVNLIGFGSWTVTTTKERNGRNPATGETMTIPAGKKVSFKAGAALKSSV